LYAADQAHVPYGPRQLGQVRRFSEGIARFLAGKGAKIIVVACNSASAAALEHLRQVMPEIPFVGMEPAVKPAAQETHTRVVGVLATPATFQGALYASVVERFGAGVTLLRDTCPGLVQQIEQGDLDGPETRRILHAALDPMQEQNIDTVVLACTHFPFVIPAIQDIVGADVRVIDPAPAVARQTQRLLDSTGSRRPNRGSFQSEFYTSGDPRHLEIMTERLLGMRFPAASLEWLDEEHVIESPPVG
jgi:glutamate racemase